MVKDGRVERSGQVMRTEQPLVLIAVKRTVVAALCAMSVNFSASYAVPASDHAANAAYADGWQTGDNGGVGFMPWGLSFSGATGALQQPAPHFIDTAPALPANSLGAPAFGLTTSARRLLSDTSEASRRFSAPLAVGETFSIDLDGSALNPAVDRFSAGNVVELVGSDGKLRFSIFTNNGYQGDRWVTWDEQGTGVPAANAFRFEFTLKSADTYDFVMRPLAGGAALFSQNNAALDGKAGTAINRLVISTYGNGSSVDGALEVFFNNMQITRPANNWNVDSGGNWSSAANWSSGVPNSVGAAAILGDRITAPRTITVDAPVTVGRIEFNNANAYTLAGASTLTLDVSTGDAALAVESGSHVIGAPLTLADNTLITVTPAASSLSLTGQLGANGAMVTKAGAGSLKANHVRAATLAINDGTVELEPSGGTSVLGALSIAGDATPTATLDLANNAAIVNYAGTSPAATVRQQIIAGRGGVGLGKTWEGMGITSSAAAAAVATEPESRSIGFAENATMPLGPYTTFRGQPVDDTTVLLALTRTGDANLDGVVNDDDVTIVGATYAPGVAGASWAIGDFDYNGFVDDDDITLLGAFYDPAAPPIAAPEGVTAVPEPAALFLAVLGLTGTAAFFRRRGA
jgi:hypothetical protein